MWLTGGWVLALSPALAQERYRVDIPDFPGALYSSDYGSVLAAPPPAGTRYRVEEPPQTDTFVAWEAIDALGVQLWHDRGYTGKGVKVAVFDVQWLNAEVWEAELGDYTTHDCEASRSCELPMDTLRPRFTWEEGSHGVACAEVIRDLAPDAELHLVRVNGGTTLENAADWAAREGIDVVSMSMSFFSTSYYDGTGPINAVVDRLMAGGVLLVNSAGNYATEHWDGDFRDDDLDGQHEFPWGSEYLPIYYGEGDHSVQILWDQYGRCGDTDFDIIAWDENANIVGRSSARQATDADECSPQERLTLHAARADWYYVQVLRVTGDPAVQFAIFARNGEVYEPTPGSIADPSSHPGSFSVGAVRADGYLINNAESFSSEGPTHGGTPKPDIAGPDGLTTYTYGSTGFYGTSAATPAVAGAIVLMLEEDPRATPREAAARLAANALSGRSTWEPFDGELGAGRARLPVGARRGCDSSAVGVAALAGWTAALAPCLLWWLRRRPRGAD